MRLFILPLICLWIAAVLYFVARVISALTQGIYPWSVLFYLPWAFGLCGLLGLISAMRDPTYKNALWFKVDILLLSLGLAGAGTFLLVSLFILFSYNLMSSTETIIFYATALLLCLLPPSVAAAMEIRRAILLLRPSPPGKNGSFYRALLVIAGGIGAVTSVPILGQEAVMLWYGRSLAAAATASAETIAAGRPYCVIDFNGAQTFEALDKRKMLLTAVDNHYGFHGFNYHEKKPHFGVSIGGERYWWSFRQRQFATHYFSWNLPATACD